jgi:formyltetrahydrofolate-dependent phosphoribosylglycinamide formyltransferase
MWNTQFRIPHSTFPIPQSMKRLVVLISGNGSNLQAVMDACASGALPAQVVAVVSNKPEAFGLQRAIQASIAAVSLPFNKALHVNRAGYDALLAEVVAAFHPDLIVLAGWMRILSPAFLHCFPSKVINLHPALPGMFAGTHGIEDGFEAFQRGEITHTGAMVHFVDDGVDTGPAILTVNVPIHPLDTLAELEQRMHEAEHRLIVEAIAKVLSH